MPEDQQHRLGDWSLGGEPHSLPPSEATPPPTAPPTTPMPAGLHRLDRQLFAVTVEHAGWAVVLLYTIVSRLIALAAAPLSGDEARRALLELASVRAAMPPDSAFAVNPSWIEIAERWVFAVFGADDVSARIVVALCGILLVIAALLMRNYIGRAGALAFAAMLAFSPTATYLARSGGASVAAMAFMLIAIVLVLGQTRVASVPRAPLIGVAIALWLTASPAAPVTAATILIALVPIGIWTMIAADHRSLRFRVWWERRRSVVLIATLAAIFAAYYLATAMLSRPLREAVAVDLNILQLQRPWSFAPGLRFYLPALALYEFLTVIFAVIGIVAAIVAVRSRLAWFAIFWAIANTTAFIAMPSHQVEFLLPILVPLALVAAIGIDALAISSAWPPARAAIAALGLLTLYIAALANFVFAAPDASRPAWQRHLLLYWIEPATTLQTRHECDRVLASQLVNSASTTFIPPDAPQVSWYLSSLAAAPSRSAAQIDFSALSAPGNTSEEPGARQFGLEESWTPDLSALTLLDAIRYLFTMKPWTNDVIFRDMRYIVRAAARTGAPAPAPSPAPSAAPTAASTASVVPSAAASVAPSPTPSAPAETPTPSPTSTPASAASASLPASPAPSSTASANI